MFAFARLVVVGFVVLTVVYICLSFYSRSVRRGKLRDEWNEGSLAGNPPGDYDTFMEQGMNEYDNSLRKKLIWGVYVVPTALIALIIYLTNFA
ncbi:MAG: hypothetical protein ABJL99_22895 [Aliishimia sp.]